MIIRSEAGIPQYKIAGWNRSPSPHAHYAFITLDAAKMIALISAGILLLGLGR
jgi:hypothetical protein